MYHSTVCVQYLQILDHKREARWLINQGFIDRQPWTRTTQYRPYSDVIISIATVQIPTHLLYDARGCPPGVFLCSSDEISRCLPCCLPVGLPAALHHLQHPKGPLEESSSNQQHHPPCAARRTTQCYDPPFGCGCRCLAGAESAVQRKVVLKAPRQARWERGSKRLRMSVRENQ